MKKLVGLYTAQIDPASADLHFFALKMGQYWGYKHFGTNDVPRAMVGMMLIGFGYSQDEASVMMREDEPLPYLDLTPKVAENSLKVWGSAVNPTLWEDVAKAQIGEVRKTNNIVVLCHDVNDVQMVRDMGGKLIRVKKRGEATMRGLWPASDITLRHSGENDDKFQSLQAILRRLNKLEDTNE